MYQSGYATTWAIDLVLAHTVPLATFTTKQPTINIMRPIDHGPFPNPLYVEGRVSYPNLARRPLPNPGGGGGGPLIPHRSFLYDSSWLVLPQ